jgi:hypothetical protein
MKNKAVTFSFDDGVCQDIRLIEILNRYHLKGTFNLSADKVSPRCDWVAANDVKVGYIDFKDAPKIYQGHEIACHTCNHLWINTLGDITLRDEIVRDKELLSQRFSAAVCGMAYPFGVYDERALAILEEQGFLYARTVKENLQFDLQQNLLEFQPTCHYEHEKAMELAKQFVNFHTDSLKIFYIWGHSYEFDCNGNWDRFEEFCRFIANRDDIFYGTNEEVFLLQKEMQK